jgi:hypothetical protein
MVEICRKIIKKHVTKSLHLIAITLRFIAISEFNVIRNEKNNCSVMWQILSFEYDHLLFIHKNR